MQPLHTLLATFVFEEQVWRTMTAKCEPGSCEKVYEVSGVWIEDGTGGLEGGTLEGVAHEVSVHL